MISYGKHSLDEEDIQAVVQQLRERTLTQGEAIAEFEAAVASYVGARYAVAVSSGTAALHIACVAIGMGPGDNMVTSANTFVASANCARYVGANAFFSDIDPQTLNMSPEDLETRCKKLGKVKAIIPVHFAGRACDMDSISRVATQYGATIIEDAAHALGGRYPNGTRIGCCSHSEMTVFSFHPVKSITTGEGGMITTNNERHYRELLRLRSHGINKADDPLVRSEHAYTDGRLNRWYYEMHELGFNYRLTEIQAVMGTSQLKKLDRFVSRRSELAARYDMAFANHPFIQPAQPPGVTGSAHHLYVIRAKFGNGRVTRNDFMQKLTESGYITQVHYIPVPLQPYYQKLGHRHDDFPNAWHYYEEALSLPLFVDLREEEQDRLVERMNEHLR
jgi:perosamine synthetase